MNNPDPIVFHIFGRPIYWYGLLIAAALIIGVLLSARAAKRRLKNSDVIIDLALIAIPLALVGARLYYVIFSWSEFAANPLRILFVWEGGLAIYGGIIGGFIGCLLFSKRRKIKLLTLLDIVSPSLVLGQAIGRWGNFFNQEAFGPAVSRPDMLWFPLAVRIDRPHYANGVFCAEPYHLATFFYESIWCLWIFVCLMMLSKRTKRNGDLFFLYILFYSFGRMLLEGLRQDSLWLIPGTIRISQLLSFLMFAGVIVFFSWRKRREKAVGPLPAFILADEPYQYSGKLIRGEEAPAAGVEEADDGQAGESDEPGEPNEPDEPDEPVQTDKPDEPVQAEEPGETDPAEASKDDKEDAEEE